MDYITNTIIEKAKHIKLLIIDVDGVLTDGKIFVLPDGESMVAFHVQDGVGIKHLLAMGIIIAVISGRQTTSVRHRLDQLGIQYIFLGVHDKLTPFNRLIIELQLDAKHIAYVGDDTPDIPPMNHVGLSIAVPNAMESVKKIAHYCTHKSGGNGAVREVCDIIQYAQTV